MKQPTLYASSKPYKFECGCDSCFPFHRASERDICEVVCNSTCGNLLLSDQILNLEIWKERIGKDATVTISVFNSAMNTASIRVLVMRNVGSPVEFTVPPGNTLSATVDNAESISVFRLGAGRTEGKFCLEVCFPVLCNNKRKHEKQECCHCEKHHTKNEAMIESCVLPVVSNKNGHC